MNAFQYFFLDGLELYVLFSICISVILGRWEGEHKRLGAIKLYLGSERILPQVP